MLRFSHQVGLAGLPGIHGWRQRQRRWRGRWRLLMPGRWEWTNFMAIIYNHFICQESLILYTTGTTKLEFFRFSSRIIIGFVVFVSYDADPTREFRNVPCARRRTWQPLHQRRGPRRCLPRQLAARTAVPGRKKTQNPKNF